MFTEKEYEEILETILKCGIRKYSSKKIVDISDNYNKKGVIAGFKSKEDMKNLQGTIYRSFEQLYKDASSLTHWTPNVFSWLGGSDGRAIYGHVEKNLIQINTFVVDLDFEGNKPDWNVLLKSILEENLYPYLILDTPHGYHIYFVICNEDEFTGEYTKASYISSANSYKSLTIAKHISMNIRKAIHKHFKQVDIGCNHFGIFRFPTPQNILLYEPNFTRSFYEYIAWSKQFEEKEKTVLKKKIKVAAASSENEDEKYYSQRDSEWYKKLLKADILEGDRNTALFTLALACKQSKLSINKCFSELKGMVNLPETEIERTINSAYNGDYKGANNEYISALMTKYSDKSRNKSLHSKNLKGNRVDPCYWIKNKKSREERKYSHFEESEKDFLIYLSEEQKKLDEDSFYVVKSMKSISISTGIALSTLKVILNNLKKEKKIIVKSSRGRNGRLRVALKSFVEMKVLINVIKNKKQNKRAIAIFKYTNSHDVSSALVNNVLVKYNNKNIPFNFDLSESKLNDRNKRMQKNVKEG